MFLTTPYPLLKDILSSHQELNVYYHYTLHPKPYTLLKDMTYDIEESQEELVSEIAPDTPLPKDLIEHLESRKQHRKDVINNPSCGLSNTNLLFQAIAHGELAMAHSANATTTQPKLLIYKLFKIF